MIRHIVMWKLRGDTAGERENNAREIREMLQKLPLTVPGIAFMEVGVNELRGDQASDLVLVSEFEDWNGLKEYAVHPDHVEVSEKIRALTLDRMSADYEF